MKNQIPGLIYAIAFYLSIFCTLAQEQKTMDIKKIGKEHGINDNYVSDIVQDNRGVYWASGLNGLIMFDGKGTQRFKLPFYKDKILQSNILSTLFFENDSTLWISNTQGVCRFNIYRHQFRPIPIKKDYTSQTLNFSVIIRDSEGQIWLSTRELGIMVYNPARDSIVRPESTIIRDLARVRNIVRLKSGKMVFCHYKGLLLYDPKTKETTAAETDKELRILSDTSARGTYSDLFFLNKATYISSRKPGKPFFSVFAFSQEKGAQALPFNSSFGFRFFKDYTNNLWIYNDGINLIENKTGKSYKISIEKSEGFSQCYTIYEDLAKNLWFCTNNGLYVLESEQVILENKSEQKEGKHVSHIYTDLSFFNNELWLATYGEGIEIHDSDLKFRKNTDLGKLSKDPDFNNTGLLYVRKKKAEMWVGGILGKLAIYDGKTGKFRFHHDTIFHDQRIAAIQEDVSGQVYIGTNSGRIVKYNDTTNRFAIVYNERSTREDPIDYISGLSFRGKDKIFVSSLFNGLYRLDLITGSIKSYKLDPENQNTIKSNDLYSMTDLGPRGIYFGSSNGLLKFMPETETFEAFTPSDGAPFTEVYSVCAYENEELLCTTSDGLYVVDMDKRNARRVGSNSPVEQINFSEAIYSPKTKTILLGSDDYFYTLYYKKRPFTFIPKSFIFDLRTTDTTYYFSNTLPAAVKLRRNQNSFTLHFGSAGYKHSEDLDYYYQIEELSENWIYLANSDELNMNNLKGGTYTFRLKTVNKESKKTVEELVLPIIIKKAFYETLWFYLAIAIAVSALFYTVYRIRLNKLLAVEKVRLKLSGDLHDDIGSTLSTINILSSIAEKKVQQDPETTRAYLRKIALNSQDIMENMSDIVWSINPANDSMQKVISKMREFANTLFEPKGIKFGLQVAEELNNIELRMEYRRDLYLVYKESLNNAAKYADCTSVTVKMFIANKHLVLCISDNGKGFDPGQESNGNGLASIQRRAGAMQAALKINSAPGKGTVVQLDMPLHIIK